MNSKANKNKLHTSNKITYLNTAKSSYKKCNLCKQKFRSKNKYILFCTHCREKNETFRFGDWMPELSSHDLDIKEVA